MPRWRQLRAFLWPTLAAILAFAGFAGIRAMQLLQVGEPGLDFAAPGAVSPEQLPAIGVANLIQPSPEMSPTDVVRTQLAGLSDPKADGLGILQCFCFASPANRAVTGPLDRFSKMVRYHPYACFARPHATLIGKPELEGSLARLLVTVMDEHHRVLAFTFILSRQSDKPYENCWMTEAVYPVGGVAPTGKPAAPGGAGGESAINDAA